MTERTLYIIGNGFDLAHNLPTRYCHFYKYCKRSEICNQDYFLFDLNEIFTKLDNNKNNWSNFEAQLSNFRVDADIKDGIKENLKTLEYYDEGFDDYELVPTFINAHLKKYNDTIEILHQKFKEWVSSVSINNKVPKYRLADNSIFLNFNYTHTLEMIYGISESKVHHIHGKVGDDKLIIGHSWDYNVSSDPLEGRFIKTPDDEVLDALEGVIIEESEAQQILQHSDSSEYNKRIFIEFRDKIISPLQKNCTDIIKSSKFFNELENLKIKEIYILGHSLSDVDMPYFEEIVSRVDNLNWIISYYDKNDIYKIETFKKRLCLSDNHCKTIKLNELLM